MVRIPVVLTLVAALAVAHSTRAAADDWSLHILADASLGWTDNLQSVPDDSVPGPENEIYAQLTPGLLFTWNLPRAINELFVSLESNVYAFHDEASSFQYRGGWRGFFLLSPLSELQASVIGSGGTANTFRTSTTADNGQVQLIDSAASTYNALDAQEAYSRQLSRPLRFTQNALASVFSSRPSEPPGADRTTGYRAGGGLGLDRAWRFNALGANVQASYDALGDGNTQVNLGGTLSWRRDISLRWSSLVDVGAVMLVPLAGRQADPVLEPTIGAQIGYYPNWGSAGLSVRRSVTPNLYIAANTISDTVVVNASLPLPWLPRDVDRQPRFVLAASAGYAFTSVIDPESGDHLSGFQAGLADVSLAYAIKPRVNVALRYQYQHQVADAGATVLDVRSFDRNTVLLTFSGRWPDRLAGEVPMRTTLRVDRSNVTPVSGTPAPER